MGIKIKRISEKANKKQKLSEASEVYPAYRKIISGTVLHDEARNLYLFTSETSKPDIKKSLVNYLKVVFGEEMDEEELGYMAEEYLADTIPAVNLDTLKTTIVNSTSVEESVKRIKSDLNKFKINESAKVDPMYKSLISGVVVYDEARNLYIFTTATSKEGIEKSLVKYLKHVYAHDLDDEELAYIAEEYDNSIEYAVNLDSLSKKSVNESFKGMNTRQAFYDEEMETVLLFPGNYSSKQVQTAIHEYIDETYSNVEGNNKTSLTGDIMGTPVAVLDWEE